MNLARLERAFRDVLAVADDQPVASLRYGTTKGWDLLAHLQLVAELEDVFDIAIEPDDVVGMSDFEAAKEILGRYGVGSSPAARRAGANAVGEDRLRAPACAGGGPSQD